MGKKIFIFFCILHSISSFYMKDDASARIVGSEIAKDGAAPYQCSLQVSSDKATKRQNCAGTILDKNYILTAGHCVQNRNTSELSILCGTNNLKSGGTYYDIEKVIEHEDYFNPPNANDIALIKIRGSIEFNEKVKPIKLTQKEVPDGVKLTITGWGDTSGEGTSFPDQLMIIRLNSITTEKCRRIFGELNIFVHDGHTCTFTKAGEGACYADSGGPLVLGDELVGVVNFGRAPCGSGYPDAYAKVSYYSDWIRSHAEKD